MFLLILNYGKLRKSQTIKFTTGVEPVKNFAASTLLSEFIFVG
jgi:hypothetical protein